MGERLRAALLMVLWTASVSAAGTGTALIDAVKTGDPAAVRVLLQQPGELTARAPDGTTALHWAVRQDDLEIVRLLLRAGASATAADRRGVTPLALAATNGTATIAEALLEAGADPNASMPEGETVLMTAARTGKPELLELLIARGAVPDARERWQGETALMWAAAENHPDAVTALIERGADPDLPSNPTQYRQKSGGQTILPRGGFTALMFAARQNAFEAARALADGGADLNRQDPEGTTALVLAIINAHYDLAAMLLEKGADPNVADETGAAALYAAVDMNTLQFLHGRPESRPSGALTAVDITRRLLAHGADPDARLKTATLKRHNNNSNVNLGEGTTPLMRAAKSGDVTLMRMLLAAGADPTLRQKNGNTLLMLAAGLGRKFNHNADSQEYERATEEDLLAGVKVCLEIGQDVNVTNAAGDTPLHVAAGGTIVTLLVQQGAGLNAKNAQGRTPYDIAILRKDGSGRQLIEGAVHAFRALGAVATVPTSAQGAEDPLPALEAEQ